MATSADRRRRARAERAHITSVRLRFQERAGVQQTVPVRLVDISEQGCGVEVESDLPVNMPVVLLGDLTNLGGGHEVQLNARVAWCEPDSDWTWRAGLEFAAPFDLGAGKTRASTGQAPVDDQEDYYELLQLSPNADNDTVQRIFRALAARFHPDNQETGNAERFRKIHEAYKTLTDPEARAAYDANYQARKRLRWKIFDQPNSAKGMHAERAKRNGILSLLYSKRSANPENPGVSIADLEDLLAVPREHLDFTLWFLRESGLATRTDNGKFSITVKGVLETEEAYAPPPAEQRNERLLVSQNGHGR